jgi:hypothetical protein
MPGRKKSEKRLKGVLRMSTTQSGVHRRHIFLVSAQGYENRKIHKIKDGSIVLPIGLNSALPVFLRLLHVGGVVVIRFFGSARKKTIFERED